MDDVEVIESTVDCTGVGSGYAFRDHNYCKIKYKLSPEDDADYSCLDTGSSISLVDADLFASYP